MSIPGGPNAWLEFVDLPRAAYISRIRHHLDRISRTLNREAEQDAAAVELIRSVGGVAPPSDSDPEPDPELWDREAIEAVTNRIEAIAARVADPDDADTTQLRKDTLFVEVVADELEEAAR